MVHNQIFPVLEAPKYGAQGLFCVLSAHLLQIRVCGLLVPLLKSAPASTDGVLKITEYVTSNRVATSASTFWSF